MSADLARPDRLGWRDEAPGRTDHLVFHAPSGGPMRTNNFRKRYWRPAVDRARLGRLRIHDLRHTAVSLCAAGATAKQVQTWAGHASITTTYDRYGHLFPGTEDRVMNVLERGRRDSEESPRGAPVLQIVSEDTP